MTTETKLPILYGEGGKGGGAAQPINDPVTLVAKQAMYALFVVSEGELTSLEDIYINDTSITNFAASFAFTRGETNQKIIPYFNETAVAEGFNYPITKYEISGALSEGVVRPILGSFEFVDITIQLTNLFRIDSAGNNLASSVGFAIYASPSSVLPSYSLVATPAISGKAIQPYPFNIRVMRPATNDGVAEWQIKIMRTSEDADQYYNSASSLSILTYYSVNNVSNYPGSALVAIRLEDASQVGGSIPTISFRGHGIKLYVPDSSYYNAATGLYRNIANTAWVSPTHVDRASWDGTFNTVGGNYTPVFSNNLSWVIYNLLSDWLYFIVSGRRYPRGFDIPKELIAKYSFEEFARYCDERLSYTDPLTGITSTSRRYTVNRQFFERKDAKYARDELLSVGNAELIEVGGLVTIIWDRPFSDAEIAASPLFTNQNVAEGKFEYASSDISENYTQINVTIQEINNKNRTRTLTVFSTGLADRLGLASNYFESLYGYNVSDFIVLGCANVAAGIRKGRSLLWDSLMTDLEGDGIVQFKTLIEGALLHKGSLIRIQDSAIFNVIQSGRISSYTATTHLLTLTLDRAITLSGASYVIVYKADGTPLELALVEVSGTHTVVSAYTESLVTLMEQSIFIQKTNKLTMYKVTNITYDDDLYTVEAVKYDARKYDYVDSEIDLPTDNGFSEVSIGKAEAVYDIRIEDFPTIASPTQKHFQISWSHNALPDRVYKYQVEWAVSSGQQGTSIVYSKAFDFSEIVTIADAIYSFTITAISSIDMPSSPVNLTFQERRWDTGTTTWDDGTSWVY